MEQIPDIPLDIQPCAVACPYVLAHPDISPPESCYGPSTIEKPLHGRVVFCWLVRQEIDSSGAVIPEDLHPTVERIRSWDPARWQELYDERLDELWESHKSAITLVTEGRYDQDDAQYVTTRSAAQLTKDLGIQADTDTTSAEYRRYEHLLELRAGLQYLPNMLPLKTADMSWEDAFKEYLRLRFPHAKGVASTRLEKEIQQRLFSQFDEGE